MPMVSHAFRMIAATLVAGALFTTMSQPPAADWLMDGGDPQRSGWQPQETRLSRETAPQMRLLWRVPLDHQPRELHALHPGLIVGRVATAEGVKEIAVVAGVSDALYAIDVERGTVLWQQRFDRAFQPPRGARGLTFLCPGGQTATPVIVAGTSAGDYVVYAVSWDGRLRAHDVATGATVAPPARFMPPNGKPYSLNVWRGVIYAATAQRCGENPDRVYAIDLRSRRVTSFSASGGGMWGRRGVTLGADGRIYTGTGGGGFFPERQQYGQSIIAVRHDPVSGSLSLADYFAPLNARWMTEHGLDMNVTGPAFRFDGREYLAQSSKECRLWLLDTAALGGGDHRTPVDQTPLICNASASYESAGVWGALSTWEDAAGDRWIVTPFWGPKHPAFRAPVEHGAVDHGALAAFKLTRGPSGPRLSPAWISRDMDRAEPPVVANGVVFGYGSGESTRQRSRGPREVEGTAARIAEATHAVLYALDAATGAELWSSGREIRSWNHFSGLSIANGRVYIATYDGVVYAYGLPVK
jgi:outer membrane protein assembly factor BamB